MECQPTEGSLLKIDVIAEYSTEGQTEIEVIEERGEVFRSHQGIIVLLVLRSIHEKGGREGVRKRNQERL